MKHRLGSPLTKRLIKGIILSLFLVAVVRSVKMDSENQDRACLEPALEVGAWLQSVAIETQQGKMWAVNPENPSVVTTDLYNGMGGVILFFVELYRSTGQESFLAEAESGADYLLANLPNESNRGGPAGLYTGIAGVGYVLEEVFKATDKAKYRQGAKHCFKLLEESAEKVGTGVQWGNVTDIISGGAGIGLYLLYAHREMGELRAKNLAEQAGRRLLELGIAENGGLKWPMGPDNEQFMPNFAHGTAGISYFLARLYRATGKQEFSEGARAGGRYLRSVTNDQGLIFHHEPGGEDLYYLGWCHGPVGTGRLYYELWRQTNDDQWRAALVKASRGVIESGIPEETTDGFWNNAGQCCGSAGVADYFLYLFQNTRQQEYVHFGFHMIADLVDRATQDDRGMRWIQAEHRLQPDLLAAQTGYAQGAAGIGLAILHWNAFYQNRPHGIRLPDSPF